MGSHDSVSTGHNNRPLVGPFLILLGCALWSCDVLYLGRQADVVPVGGGELELPFQDLLKQLLLNVVPTGGGRML